jgi:DNA-binding NarL/FixJ family response regulator
VIRSVEPVAARDQHQVISIVLVDDEDLVRSGLKQVLLRGAGFSVVAETRVGRGVLSSVGRLAPDVLVLGVGSHGEVAALELVARLSEAPPRVRPKVLMLADQQVIDRNMTRAIQLGVSGLLLRGVSAEELLYAVRQVSRGHSVLQPRLTSRLFAGVRNFVPHGSPEWRGDLHEVLVGLSPRERDVLAGITRGMSNQEIAEDFQLAVATVKSHVSSILNKMGARDRLQAALMCLQFSLFHGDR